MKSKSIFLMAVSLGFGLVAAIGITQVMGRSNQPAPTVEEPKLPVLVAIDDIDINAELLPEMFSEEEWPARLVPEGVATSLEEIEKSTEAIRNHSDKIADRVRITRSSLLRQLEQLRNSSEIMKQHCSDA